MGNSLNTNPVVINTVGTDITVGTGAVSVSSIVMEDTTNKDTATFIDNNGVEVLRLSANAANVSEIWTPAEPHTFQNGLILDKSASTFATGGKMFIFLD